MSDPTGSLVCFLDERDTKRSMLVGGFYISRSELKKLDERISSVKEEFNIPITVPVKWNLRDDACKIAFERIGKENVSHFRERMFDSLKSVNIRLITSLVWKGDPSYTEDAWKWALENVLQRLCIILDRKKIELQACHEYPTLDVVFDWLPAKSKVDEYLGVYADAYHNGYSFTKNTLPALKACGACPCMLVTSVRHSPALQAADMALGAVGDFFTWAYEDRRKENVLQHFVPLYALFHRDERGKVLGNGLIVKKNTQAGIDNKLRVLGLVP